MVRDPLQRFISGYASLEKSLKEQPVQESWYGKIWANHGEGGFVIPSESGQNNLFEQHKTDLWHFVVFFSTDSLPLLEQPQGV